MPSATMSQDKTPTQCPLCPKVLNGIFGLRMHLAMLHKRHLDSAGNLLPEGTPSSKHRKKAAPEYKGARPGPNGVMGEFFKDGKYHCPDCLREFAYPTAFGRHRQIAHGVPGSKAGVKVDADPAKPKFKNGFYRCPECSFKHVKAVVVGTHRRSKHGIQGRSAGAVAARNQLSLPTNGGKTHEISRTVETQTHTNGEAAYDPIPYALAVGSIKEFCRNFAEEHGLVTRVFTRQLAELFLREARR
jgi:hypothetical protein